MKAISHRLAVVGILAFGLLRAGADGRAYADDAPHAGQPVLRSEHAHMLDLAPAAAATHAAVKDGAWSDRQTWRDQQVPIANADVLIPRGITVTLDGPQSAVLRTVRVDGNLRFATDRDTGLIVDTFIVAPGGTLTIGTPEQPVAAGVTARVTFADRGPIDAQWDPTLLSRGLVAHGVVTINGSSLTTHAALAGPAHRGDTKLLLARAPSNWKRGDRIVLTGTSRKAPSEDEVMEVLGVTNSEVEVKPLAFDHVAPAEGLSAHVANLTRNIIFASQNEHDAARAGHVMFMHSPKVNVAYAAFENLGRTDKLKPIDDPRLDDSGHLAPGSGTNARGRYALHFHRTGTDGSAAPARVAGCAIVNGPGWGCVSHSSSVDFEDNVAFNVTGSAFVTEAGDEVGSFRRNIAIRSIGSGLDEDARHKLQDFGHEGDGFWFQGGGVIVEENIAAGQAGNGFIYFTEGLDQDGLDRTRFATANLWDRSWATSINRIDHKDAKRANDPDSVPVIAVPIRSFKDNVAFACGTGFTTRFMAPQPARSVLRDSAAWNCGYGVRVRYTTNLDLVHLRLISAPTEKPYVAIFGTLEGEQDIHYVNLDVQGWPVGIHVPEAGHHVIDGGYWNNARSIVIPTPLQRGRSVEIQGDIRFGTPAQAPKDSAGRQYDIDLDAVFAGLLGGREGYRDPNVLFAPDAITYKGKQLYYVEQAADVAPFKSATAEAGSRKKLGDPATSLPMELIDRTNRQMWDSYGLALAGAVAPADAVAAPRIHGLIGTPVTYPAQVRPAVTRTSQRQAFQLLAFDSSKRTVVRAQPTDLRNGWNLLTAAGEDGVARSFLVFTGDAKAPGKEGKYAK